VARVSQEMTLSSPILADELNTTFLEVQAGVTRADSFRRLAERTGVEDLRSLSAMLIQTDIFGTSVARALRIHSDGMRIKRMQQAEEKAAMVSVKMTIPLVLCILPSLIAVVMGARDRHDLEVLRGHALNPARSRWLAAVAVALSACASQSGSMNSDTSARARSSRASW